jgi:hypothetical protein
LVITEPVTLCIQVAKADERESGLAKQMREKKEKSSGPKIIQRELSAVFTQVPPLLDSLSTEGSSPGAVQLLCSSPRTGDASRAYDASSSLL